PGKQGKSGAKIYLRFVTWRAGELISTGSSLLSRAQADRPVVCRIFCAGGRDHSSRDRKNGTSGGRCAEDLPTARPSTPTQSSSAFLPTNSLWSPDTQRGPRKTELPSSRKKI